MSAVSSKPSCGSLVRERNGDSCQNNMATGTRSINASPDGVNESVFEKLFEHFSQDRDMEYLLLDSTIVRARACAAGAQKKMAHQV